MLDYDRDAHEEEMPIESQCKIMLEMLSRIRCRNAFHDHRKKNAISFELAHYFCKNLSILQELTFQKIKSAQK